MIRFGPLLLAAFLLRISWAASGEAPPLTGELFQASGLEAVMAANLQKSTWSGDHLREVARNVGNLPEPAAAAVLWETAGAPPLIDPINLFANALSYPSPDIRSLAMSILVAEPGTDAKRLLLNTLVEEENENVIQAAVGGIAHLPLKQAVRGLMDIMFATGVRGFLVESASVELRRLTRSDVPDDASAWRDWWLDNEHLYN